MASEKFRRQLRQEAQQWETEGLISPEQRQQLAARYQLAQLEATAQGNFTLVLVGLGCVLLGLGVITFVAANWQDWGRPARVLLLLSVFVGVNAAGFYLWRDRYAPRVRSAPGAHSALNPNRRSPAWRQRLGQGLLLLGGLILGANLALMAQMFHIGGPIYGLYVPWALGVAVMAYSLRLASLGVLSAILMAIAYGYAWVDMSSWMAEGSPLNWLLWEMPLAAAVLYLPLAYWCRSRGLFALAALGAGLALMISPNGFGLGAPMVRWAMPVMLFLPPALLVGYSDGLWQRTSTRQSFEALARALGVLFLGILFYWFSFHWSFEPWTPPGSAERRLWQPWLSLVGFGLVAVVEWAYLWGRSRPSSRLIALAGLMAVGLAVMFWHWVVGPIPVVATFLFNALLAVLAIGSLRESLASGQRRLFWFGIGLLTLQILSRLLEYDTDLLLKALVFGLCGLGVMAAGLWFEKYIRRAELHADQP